MNLLQCYCPIAYFNNNIVLNHVDLIQYFDCMCALSYMRSGWVDMPNILKLHLFILTYFVWPSMVKFCVDEKKISKEIQKCGATLMRGELYNFVVIFVLFYQTSLNVHIFFSLLVIIVLVLNSFNVSQSFAFSCLWCRSQLIIYIFLYIHGIKYMYRWKILAKSFHVYTFRLLYGFFFLLSLAFRTGEWSMNEKSIKSE